MKQEPIFNWDVETGTATCIISNGEKVFCGVAVCHPEDLDMKSEKTGCEIAFLRARIKYYQYYKECLKERLSALNQLYYSMNRSKYFNPKSYENKMLQRQILFIKDDLTTIKSIIVEEQEKLKSYISEKEKFYKKLRKIRNA